MLRGNIATAIHEDRLSAALMLLGAALSSALWMWGPSRLGGWPLVLALLPWGFHWARHGALVIPRTGLEAPLFLFLATAGVAVWAAYDPILAWDKFWILSSAVIIFYAVAIQPKSNLWPLAALFTLCGVVVAAFFLLTHNWEAAPVGIGLSDALGQRLMALRGWDGTAGIIPNRVAGLIAMSIPFGIAIIRHIARPDQIRFLLLPILAAGVILITALIATGSRGALVGLMCGAAAWLAISARHSQNSKLRRIAWAGAFFLILLICIPLAWAYWNSSLPESIVERVAIARHTLWLVGDFPFTGGGLGAFPALYSEYILVVPFFFYPYSHNMFVDVAVEQGLIGFGTFVVIGVVTGLSLWRHRGKSLEDDADRLTWLVAALFTSFIVVGVHGLVTDTLYGIRGTPLLFFIPALTAAILSRDIHPTAVAIGAAGRRAKIWPAIVVFSILLLIALGAFHRPLLAAWQANLGAVSMARTQLAQWPLDRWDDGSNVAALEPAEAQLTQALNHREANRTAHHRLGLIALLRRDFTTAVSHLEAAYRVAPRHPGIRKSLGYSYAWSGQLDKATQTLAEVPEAAAEMEVYTWWWQAQGREDLSVLAAETAARLR